MADREKNMERPKYKYLKKVKCFLDELKNTFHSLWRAIIWWKIKFDKKIADTSFKPASSILATPISSEQELHITTVSFFS